MIRDDLVKHTGKQFNWAGNYQYSTESVFYPRSVEDVQEIVQRVSKAKVLGTRHSFNGIADSDANFITLENLEPVMVIDKKSNSVTVGAGVRYGQLAEYINSQGFALHNLGSLPHISVAGACVSATHGSGVKNGILASAVRAIEIVTARGEVLVISQEKDADRFYGSVVNLGALGVITKLTLDIQPAFNVAQDVFENLPLSELQYNLESILSAGYSVSLFTDWKSDLINQVWIKRISEEGDLTAAPLGNDFFGAAPATKDLHPIPGMPEENCTAQRGIRGPWHERLPHFKMNFTPSSGAELQSEYFVPLPLAYKAIMAINQMREHFSSHLLISELRTVDADNFWMSPCYQQPCLAIHFTWQQNWASVSKILPKIEEKLAPFGARPHWAKLFTMQSSRLKLLYKRLPDFQKLVSEYDPEGKFRNAFLEKNVLEGK